MTLANGQSYTDEKIERLVDAILEGDKAAPSQEAKGIAPKSDATEQVSLRAITDIVRVSALIPGQTLRFRTTGLTVIYGDNGSGKSGYARLIKAPLSPARAVSERASHSDVPVPAEYQPKFIRHFRSTQPTEIAARLRSVQLPCASKPILPPGSDRMICRVVVTL